MQKLEWDRQSQLMVISLEKSVLLSNHIAHYDTKRRDLPNMSKIWWEGSQRRTFKLKKVSLLNEVFHILEL